MLQLLVKLSSDVKNGVKRLAKMMLEIVARSDLYKSSTLGQAPYKPRGSSVIGGAGVAQ